MTPPAIQIDNVGMFVCSRNAKPKTITRTFKSVECGSYYSTVIAERKAIDVSLWRNGCKPGCGHCVAMIKRSLIVLNNEGVNVKEFLK